MMRVNKMAAKYLKLTIFPAAAMVLLMLFNLSDLKAGSYEFRAIAVNGDVDYKTGSSGNWKTLKVGTELQKSYSIRLKRSSYAGLVHISGKTRELEKNGSYSVSELSKQVSVKESGLNKRFTKYVIDEISDADDLMSYGDYHDDMGTVGSVERAIDEDFEVSEKIGKLGKMDDETKSSLRDADKLVSLKKEMINIRFPRSSYIIDEKIAFSWRSHPEVKEYKLVIKDKDNHTVFSKKLRDTALAVNVQETGIQPGKNYYWKVKSDKISSSEYCIYRHSEETSPQLFAELKEMKSSYATDRSALNNIIMASFYDEHNIMQRALQCYQRAMKLSSKTKEYQKLYSLYLGRIGLREEARKFAQ